MRQVTLSIPDNKYPLFMELARSLNFVKKIEVDEDSSKEKVLKGIKQSVKEVNLVKAGKLKPRNARDLISEL
jgi:predicted nucleotide-binding protein (sugar kinase/HSP70/actin superfamily)